jgi:hypothetical protein
LTLPAEADISGRGQTDYSLSCKNKFLNAHLENRFGLQPQLLLSSKLSTDASFFL